MGRPRCRYNDGMHEHYATDAFGDPFDLDDLPLPRPARGYAVQRLDTDQLLDRNSQTFLPVRSPGLEPFFASFAEAHVAAGNWSDAHAGASDHHLAIVPAGYDPVQQRPILIYGVLCGQP